VRDALFALAAGRLAPDGIVYVSFNVLPGCRIRQAAWDMHAPPRRPHRRRAGAARALRVSSRASSPEAGTGDSRIGTRRVRAELRAIAERSDSELCHGRPRRAE
jgi:hypothetical protein